MNGWFALPCALRFDGCRAHGDLRSQSRPLPDDWPCILPASRCGAVHDQPQGANRDAHRTDERLRSQRSRSSDQRYRHGGFPLPDLFRISEWCRISSLYTTNTGAYTATIRAAYRRTQGQQLPIHGRVQRHHQQYPELRTFFQTAPPGRHHQYGDAGPDRYSGEQSGYRGRLPAGA